MSANSPTIDYEYTHGGHTWDPDLVLPTIRRYLRRLPPGARLLDLGCGNGAVLATFRDRGWELVGVDGSESAIQQARRHHPALRFEHLDVTHDLRAWLPPASFDAVISLEVIEHLFDPRGFVRNCRRLLKPDGTLVLTTPYHGYLKNVAIAVAGKSDRHYNPLWDSGHIKFWSKRTLAALLDEAGFGSISFACRGRFPFMWKDMIIRASPRPS